MARFEIPVHRLFGIAQYDAPHFRELKKSVANAVHGNGKDPSHRVNFDEPFVRGKFLDIVNQQFDLNRSVVELASNAVDATRDSGGNSVDISIGPKGIVIKDSGAGMPLESIMQNLAIPYFSGKAKAGTVGSAKQVGRFGLGFLSNLSFLTKGKASLLRVESNAGGQSTAAEFRLQPSPASPTGNDIVATFDRATASPGTSVEIRGQFSKEDVKGIGGELQKYLKYVNPDAMKIRLNGRQLNNKPKLSRFARRYEIPFGNEKIGLEVDFASKTKDGYIPVNSGEILLNEIRQVNSGKPHHLVISMPASLPVGENRRDFRESRELDRAQALVFGKLWQYTKDMEGKRKFGLDAMRFSAFKKSILEGYSGFNQYIRAFAANADKSEIVDFANSRRNPFEQRLDASKPMVVSSTDLDATHFISKDASFYGKAAYTGFVTPFNSFVLLNPTATHLADFLKKKCVSKPVLLSKLDKAERESLGFEAAPGPDFLVHKLDLAPTNHSPFLFIDPLQIPKSYNKEKPLVPGLYVNINHPALKGTSPQDKAWVKRCLDIAMLGQSEAEASIIGRVLKD